MAITQNGVLKKDDNDNPVMGGTSSSDNATIINSAFDPVTRRLLTDTAGGGSGTVTSVSVVTANGFAGTVANPTTTPAITLTTTITGVLSGNGTAISAASTTGTGAVVLANTPTLITPVIGVATGTSLALTGVLSSGTNGGTGGQLTLTGATSGSGVLKVSATAGAGIVFQLPSANGSNGNVLTTDGAGVTSWAAGPAATLTVGTTTIASGTTTRILYDNAGTLGEYTLTGTGTVVVMQNTPTLTTPVLGVATATSINKVAITAPATSATLTIADGKTLTISNTLTLAGTDSTTMTFPTTSATIARTDAGNTFTGVSTASAWVLTSPTITTKISPTSDDGAPLGDTTHNFSDLFLASGALINIANGNWVATHTSGILTVTTGDLRVTSANVGTNADSVPTLSSTSTLTNKTLTSPTIQTSPVLAAATNLKFTVPSSDVTGTGITTNEFNSGYSSTAIGDLVYLDSSATWQKADADASAATYSSMLGIALSVTASGAAATVLLQGFVYAASPFPTFTIGAPIYMSATAGAVTQTAPVTTDSATRVVGYGVHADKMWFNPSNDWITHT